jgi:hypothetical protein
MAAEVESKKKILDGAKEKAGKAEAAPATPATALLRLEESEEKLTSLQADHEKWYLAATKRKDEQTEKHRLQVEEFRKIANALFLEADKRAEQIRVNTEKWDEANTTINSRWLRRIEAQKAVVKELSTVAPKAAAAVPTPIAEVPPAPVVVPPLKPLVQLPPAELPESAEDVGALRSTLEGLQLLEEQELHVRVAYPVCWGDLAKQGMRAELLKSLLPADCLGSGDEVADHVQVPQRTLGALRRQLDFLAAKWEAKGAEFLRAQEVQAGVNALYSSVMDEAKRVQRRKRLPSSEAQKGDAGEMS